MPIGVQFAETPEQIAACFPAFYALRPHLKEDAFVARVQRQQAEGYHLIYLADPEAPEHVVAAAGWRILNYLAWGRVLYIDDLITLPAERRKGYSGYLLDWLIARAREERCDEVHLDSGYQRHDAHRLYLNKGFQLACHYFGLRLGGAG